jgi:hypothetical protein
VSYCDWNPTDHEPAVVCVAHGPSCTSTRCSRDCKNQATLIVGGRMGWHLCASCADLPEFKKYRYRKPLKEATK